MRRTRRSIAATLTICLSLVLSLSGGILLSDRASAAPNQTGRQVDNGKNRQSQGQDKVSPDLRDRMRGASSSDNNVNVILQLNAEPSGQLNALLNRNGIHIKSHFENFNSYAVELPASVVDELAQYDEVAFLSPDSEVASLGGHIADTTGADLVRSQTTAAGAPYLLDGSGIGIAILDSGITQQHKDFLNQSLSKPRVTYAKDFTTENYLSADRYGHGTHVAALAAGMGFISNAAYIGMAPNANIVNLKVLDRNGKGTTSTVLGALNWLLTNYRTYNIKVVNMSLGTPAVNSYTNDPLCLAVRKLVNAGMVVVCAAGNDGKNAAGQKTYGTIHSPGNEPSAITVGAANTFGTDYRSDDVVTTYSSRGPTRSYWTDAYGTKHYDNLVKPDLVAPGNKIISAAAASNYLVKTYPQIDTNLSTDPSRDQMYLNGTSMASPIVAGAAALLLQLNPKLTPNMVKMILMYTAQQLPNQNTFEQGAGELNLEGAARLAKAITVPTSASLGASLISGTAPTPQTTIAGQTFPWSQGIVLDYTYAKGTALITKYQKIYDLGVLLGDGTLISSKGVLLSDSTKLSLGVLLGDSLKTSNGVLLGDGTFFCGTGVLLGDGVLLSDGVLLGDGVLLSDSVLLSNGVLLSDSTAAMLVATDGDNTAGMLVVPDFGVDYMGY